MSKTEMPIRPISFSQCLFQSHGKSKLLFLILFIHFQLVGPVASAQYTKLLDFGSTAYGTQPYGTPFSDGTFLYGTTSNGGASQHGTIYKVKADGTGFTTLFDFNDDNGSIPVGSLILQGGFLYGTTYTGGANGQGSIFEIKPDGTGFATVFDFSYFASGGFPVAGLFSDGTYLYGTTTQGGTSFYGTMFKVLLDGTGYTRLLDFDATNNGGTPKGNLVSDGTFLYATTFEGGALGRGTIVKIKTDGTGFVKLLDFNGNPSGSNPDGGLILDGTSLYGMTLLGGANNHGAIIKINTDGTGFAKLFDFSNTITGGFPKGALVYDGSFLYGMTAQGGLNAMGTIFKIATNGTGFLKLIDIDGNTGGPQPEGTLLLEGTTLVGVRSSGGTGSLGGILKINTNGTGYTKLYSFVTTGIGPVGSVVSDGVFLYGMTSSGGAFNKGTLYKIRPDGTGFTSVLDFAGTANGNRPTGSLILEGGFLFGMTSQGGTNDQGTMFKIKPDGTGFVKLVDFADATSGSYPGGSLVSDGTFLYGMTAHGGTTGYGTIFKILPNGTGFLTLLNLDYTNNGAYPNGSLILNGGFLYGMTYQGGSVGFGTVFEIQTNGAGFVKLVDFDYDNGANPYGSLISDGTFLYGMTYSGGPDYGNVFKIKTDGTGFVSLLAFDEDKNGSSPYGSLISDGTFLIGMTSGGGTLGQGTIFKIKPDGTNYTKVLDFNDGAYPDGTLFSDGDFLYGTTGSGGDNSKGTFFKASTLPFTSISNFSPMEGVEGTLVTVNGTFFDPVPANNIVKFNNVTAVVMTSTADSLTVFVPAGATDGPVSVTANGMATSVGDFVVTAESKMFNGIVKNCDVVFVSPNSSDDVVQTFLPVNPTDKVRVSFTSFNVGDALLVYDGPTTASPAIDTLYGNVIPADIVATGPGGELTIRFVWQDSSSSWEADITCESGGDLITIGTQPADKTVCAGTIANFTMTASGTTNINFHWQYSPDGIDPYLDIINGGAYSNATTATLSVNTTGNFGAGLYRCRIGGDNASQVLTNEATLVVNPTPSSPLTVNPATVCSPANVNLTVSGATNGHNYVWYATPTGGTPISGADSTYVTPPLTVTTTYYVAITDGTCESPRTPAIASIQVCTPPVIAPVLETAFIEGIVTFDFNDLITDNDGNLDMSSLQLVSQPASGAPATLSGTILTINYSGFPYSSTDMVRISVCDFTGLCTTQQVVIEFAGDITVFNAVSPNGDGKNDFLLLQYIDIIPDKKQNQVKIFSRWGDEVFSISNYNNHDRVFVGSTNEGSKLPTGTYFYKISFASGEKTRTGFLELKY